LTSALDVYWRTAEATTDLTRRAAWALPVKRRTRLLPDGEDSDDDNSDDDDDSDDDSNDHALDGSTYSSRSELMVER